MVTLPEKQDTGENLDISFWERNENISIPDIFIPIDAQIKDFSLENIEVNQAGSAFSIASISLAAQIKGHDVDIDQLQLVHQSGELSGSLTAQLRDAYSIAGHLQLTANRQDLPETRLQIDISGSMDELEVNGKSHSPFAVEFELLTSPLKSELPLRLNASWSEISQSSLLPLETANFTLNPGVLEIQGNINEYQVRASSVLEVPQVATPIDIALNANLIKRNLDVENLTLKLLSGTLTSAGQLVIEESFPWKFETKVANLNGQIQDTRYPSEINGEIEYSGVLQDGKISLYADKVALRGIQQGYPLSVDGNVAFAKHLDLLVASLKASHRDNHLQGFTRILGEERLDADLIVSIDQLSQSIPDYSGEIRGNILAMGSIKEPQIELDLDLVDIVANSDSEPSLLIDKAQLLIEGTDKQQSISIEAHRKQSALSVNAQVDMSSPIWLAEISTIDLSHNNFMATLNENSTIEINPELRRINAKDLCLQTSEKESACIKSLSFERDTTFYDVALENVSVNSILSEFNSGSEISTNAKSNIASKGKYSIADGLEADFEGMISNSEWYLGEATNPTTVLLEKAVLVAKAKGRRLNSNFNIDTSTHGSLRSDLKATHTANGPEVIINTHFKDLNIEPISHLNHEINHLSGIVNGELIVRGNLASPSIDGTLDLESGLVDVARSPALIEDWSLNAHFSQKTAEIISQFKLGEGQGSLKGNLSWQDGLLLESALQGENLSLSYKESTLVFTPDIVALVSPTEIRVDGTVIVPEADIVVKGIPQNAITPSSDVHLRGEPEPTSLLDVAEVNLELTIDPNKNSLVKLDAFGLEADLAGQLRLATQPSPMGFGDLQILNGQYRAYGQELLIRTGEVQFNGPFSQPILFIEAIRDPDLTEDNVIAGIVIDGIANKPNIRLFSEPDMDQGASLAYLLSGKGDVGGSEVDNNAFAGLLVGFGVSNSDGLTGNMGKALGIDDLQLDARGSGKNTQVAVSGTIAPNLTLEYGVGVFDSVSEVKLRYKLMPKLYVEAISGLEHSLLIFYEFSVGEIEKQTHVIE
jgi:translocation and assembly module TamB